MSLRSVGFYKMKLLNIHKINRGFTVVELLVVVSIMVIMTTIVLFNYNKFNDSMLISNLAYDVSLTIRQAQTYGVAVLELPGSNSGSQIAPISHHAYFAFPYGVHFDINSSNFTLYVDADSNAVYTGTSEKIQSYSFQRGIKFQNSVFR